MSMRINKELPSPAELKREYPLSDKLKELKNRRDAEIRDIFTGKSDKFVVIIGPCSADNEDSVCEYVNRLAGVNEKVKDKLVLIPRIYTNKPRTTGEGYKGMLHQPDPDKAPDLYAGILAIRKMHIRAMEETGLTIKNLHYYGSQPWPYPCGLMVGFLAEYDNGDIHLQRSELSRGAWFNRHHLPQIPEKLSIARQIIDYWLDLKSKEDSNKE